MVDTYMSEDEDVERVQSAFEDFVKAQTAIGNVGKDAKGNYGKFVSLAKLLEAVVPAFNANGLVITQGANAEGTSLTTTITHKNGVVVAESAYPISVADRSNPQKVGSGVTYARRYSLMSLVAVAGDDDDEGELAAKPKATPKTKSPLVQLTEKLGAAGVNANNFAQVAKESGFDVKSSKDLTDEQVQAWLDKLAETPF